jgi:hypothetical protein
LSLYRFSLPAPTRSNLPYAHRGILHERPTIRLWMIGPGRPPLRLDVKLDTGADYCVFPAWLTPRVGVSLAGASPDAITVSSVGTGGSPTWFRPVDLEVRDETGAQRPFRWTATVGFISGPSFLTSPVSGVLGVNGGLDRFQRVEFDWYSLQTPEIVLRT